MFKYKTNFDTIRGTHTLVALNFMV